jgi:hypothetical protein
MTTVRLGGSATWPNNSALLESNPVRLPKGEIGGWRANPADRSEPHLDLAWQDRFRAEAAIVKVWRSGFGARFLDEMVMVTNPPESIRKAI